MCQFSDNFCHAKSDGSKEYRVLLFYASKSTVFSYSVDSKGKMHKLEASIACKIRETIKVSAPKQNGLVPWRFARLVIEHVKYTNSYLCLANNTVSSCFLCIYFFFLINLMA